MGRTERAQQQHPDPGPQNDLLGPQGPTAGSSWSTEGFAHPRVILVPQGALDFVKGPLLSRGNTVIMTFVDRFSKDTHPNPPMV